jgi:hypothetical protein
MKNIVFASSFWLPAIGTGQLLSFAAPSLSATVSDHTGQHLVQASSHTPCLVLVLCCLVYDLPPLLETVKKASQRMIGLIREI